MSFEFATVNHIIFGTGELQKAGEIARSFGARALVVTGANGARARPLLNLLNASGVAHSTFAVAHEPTIDAVLAGVQQARKKEAELVVGFGGGSAVDAGKAIAALLTNDGEPLDYLEVIGKGQPLTADPAPYIAIPTTAGTGAEVTRNAVLASPAHRVKVSLRHPLMLPDVAIVDPALTHDVPPEITAYTGMDALTQVLEPLVSHLANPLTDAICWAGLERAAWALPRVYADGQDAAAREAMALASLFGGLGLANAKLGAVHGFAGPIGGMFDAPHGAVCATLLPHCTSANVRALRQREPQNRALQRYEKIARLLVGDEGATVEDGVRWLEDLAQTLRIPKLGAYGITPDDIPAIIEKSARSSSMKGNPIVLTEGEMGEILMAAI